jgi:hypothetical protein
MPLTHHDDQEFVAGDDWTIDGLLLDVNGSPLDITNANFEWTLIDPTGETVDDLVGSASIQIVQPGVNGQVRIKVPAQFTTSLLAGRFHDALRVTLGYISTFWVGTILVDCNPFGLIPPLVPPDADLMSFSLTASAAGFDTPTIAVH